MTKKKATDLVLAALCILILVGVGLSVYAAARDKNVIRVDLEPSVTQAVEFEDLCLLPGETGEYRLNLNCETATPYTVTLQFVDRAPTYTLKDHAYVRIEKGDELLAEQRLADAFAAAPLQTVIDTAAEQACHIKITFYLPADVGNEAQNAEADFALLITASNE